MSKRRPPRPTKGRNRRVPDAQPGIAEPGIAELRRELAEAQEKIARMEREGAGPYLARRVAELEEGQKVARGQAVEAALARSRAEAELRALRDAIGKAPGLHGWLLRRAQRRLG